MTHAWLFTGPPGSGRSNAAIAFAAALQCERGGCGECHACATVLAGSHPDVSVTRAQRAQIATEDMRDPVHRSALAPAGRRHQVMIIEDADRLHERAANALLKAIEEPTPKTAWLLCTPTLEDVLPTIRSRCRNVALTTPTAEEVARFLVDKDGVLDAVAAFAARASQVTSAGRGAFARDEGTRNRRRGGRPAGRPGLARGVPQRRRQPRRHRQGRDRGADGADQLRGGRRARPHLRRRPQGTRLPRLPGRAAGAHLRPDAAGEAAPDGRHRPVPDGHHVRLPRRGGGPGPRTGALVNEEMRPEVEDLARRSTPRTTCVASTRSSRPASR